MVKAIAQKDEATVKASEEISESLKAYVEQMKIANDKTPP